MLFVPAQVGAMYNFPKFPIEAYYLAGIISAMFVMLAVGFFLAARDPARHRTWVQAGIVGYALPLVVTIGYLLRGAISWDIATVPFIIQIVFLIALVVLYPRSSLQAFLGFQTPLYHAGSMVTEILEKNTGSKSQFGYNR